MLKIGFSAKNHNLMRSCVVMGCVGILLGTSGCSFFKDKVPDQRLAYKKQVVSGNDLEIPPDLVSGSYTDLLDIPNVSGTATLNDYQQKQNTRKGQASANDVLPETAGITIRGTGNNRWIAVDGSAQAVWPRLIAFWREQGILLVEQNPQSGTMRTDWLENRADIRRDLITNLISKVAPGIYSAATRDQYTVRLERSGKSTNIYLTHKGMEEKISKKRYEGGSPTMWVPSGSDPERANIMMQRMVAFLGGNTAETTTTSAATTKPLPQPVSPATPMPLSNLPLADEPSVAWNKLGNALNSAGFTVIERNSAQNTYHVQYLPDPGDGQKPGFFKRMKFWGKKKKTEREDYLIKVQPSAGGSVLQITDTSGVPVSSGQSGLMFGILKPYL